MLITFVKQTIGIGEDDNWLAGALIRLNISFCFVRSKIDNDIKNAEADGIEKKTKSFHWYDYNSAQQNWTTVNYFSSLTRIHF